MELDVLDEIKQENDVELTDKTNENADFAFDVQLSNRRESEESSYCITVDVPFVECKEEVVEQSFHSECVSSKMWYIHFSASFLNIFICCR